jgi:ribosomal protein S18 acetylase RimI-like enzyme
MRAAMDRLAGLPYDETVLWTFKDNVPAIAFYERHGWRADGEEKVHPRTQAVAIRFRHPTSPR